MVEHVEHGILAHVAVPKRPPRGPESHRRGRRDGQPRPGPIDPLSLRRSRRRGPARL